MKPGGKRREIEIKLAVPSAAAARRLLARHGFRLEHRRTLQSDTVLDDARGRLRRSGALLRLRRAGKCAWLTYKGRALPGRFKDREELEQALTPDAAAFLAAVLKRLGFDPVFRYEKYRTEYRPSRGAGLVALDETPIGVFLELEGPAAWIDRTARKLGFSEADYIRATYADLYLAHCRRLGRKPGDMLFRGAAEYTRSRG